MANNPFEMDLKLQVGRYDIQKLLGRGATGTVYLARDTFSGREVALKTIEPEVLRDPEFGAVYRTQFLNEASLAGKLRHPHIVGILDAALQENSGYIAMELVTQGDLSRHTRPGKLLPVADVLQIGFKCCGALDYACKEGIVHRDIKPANLMLAQGTDVKISDFGAAALRKTQVVQSNAMGSPYYMSPEQIQGHKVGFGTDMYSLGVVLYELLTGQRPFSANNLESLIQKITLQPPVPPSKVRHDLPEGLDRIVLRALAKKAEQRYESWAEFARELSEMVEKILPPTAIPDSEKYVALKKVEMFAALSDVELWELARAATWLRVAADETIVRENEKDNKLYFLAKGQAKVSRQGRVINLMNESECFGEMAYIRGSQLARRATVSSVTPVTLAEFESDAIAAMSLGAQLCLTRALVRNLADRLEMANAGLHPTPA